MNRIAKLRDAHSRCLLAASEIPADQPEIKDGLIRLARKIEAQIPGMGDEAGSPQGMPRMQYPPDLSGEPVPGGMLDPRSAVQPLPESNKAVISLKVEINLPADPDQAEKVKNAYVSGLFQAIEGSGGSIVGHDVKKIQAKQPGA